VKKKIANKFKRAKKIKKSLKIKFNNLKFEFEENRINGILKYLSILLFA
jgi:hypothetical protein